MKVSSIFVGLFAAMAFFCLLCECNGNEGENYITDTDEFEMNFEDDYFHALEKRSVMDESPEDNEIQHREKRGLSFRNYIITICKQRFCNKNCGAIVHWNQSTKRKLRLMCHHCHARVCSKIVKILG